MRQNGRSATRSGGRECDDLEQTKNSGLCVGARVAGMACEKPYWVGWHPVAHLQERFRHRHRQLRRSARPGVVLRMDRWTEAARRQTILAADIHPAAAQERMVQEK